MKDSHVESQRRLEHIEKANALTLEGCKGLPKFKTKQRLVFAPAKYVDDHTCLEYRIDFCQLPYEIYRLNR